MSSNRSIRLKQVGMDRLVRLEWLEQTTSLVLAGNEYPEIKEVLQADLKDAFRSDNPNVRGSIDKTITILLKVWLKVPDDLESLRQEGLQLLRRLPQPERLAVHWGMVMAVYPFWAGVATQVGRLLRLQGSAAAAHVQRRVREQYGERETVSRRVRYVLRSYLDWGVLNETGTKGIYKADKIMAVDDPKLIVWMIETLLHTRSNGSGQLKDLMESPSLFPFRLPKINAGQLTSESQSLIFLRHALDDDLVMLKKNTPDKID